MRSTRWRILSLCGVSLLVLAMNNRALGAQGTVRGRVTVAGTNQPLRDARVLALGTNAEGITGEDGSYQLRNVRAGAIEVQVLRVGYQSQKKTVTVTSGATANADFVLAPAVIQLSEIVSTATGSQRRIELGNAVTTLGNVSDKVEQSSTHSIADLLVARAPGVIVLPGVMTGGAPTVRIRGLSSISLSNAPIYIVDGIRYADNSFSGGNASFSLLNNLSANEIEDVEIVKGPSAATLYGTNASNGVILITTKKGRAGNARWTYFAELGRVEDWSPYQDMYANWGHAPGSTTPIRCKLATMGPTTCISDSITSYNLLKDKDKSFINTGNRKMFGMNVSGGSEAVRYFVSAEADNEVAPLQMPEFEIKRFEAQNVSVREEWLHPESQQKVNFRANVNAALSPKLDIGVSTGYGYSYNHIPPSGAAFEALVYVGMMNYGFKGPGLDKVVNDSKGTPLNDYFQYAPGDVMQRYRPAIVQRTTASANANWRPLSWMQNDATFGVDLANRDQTDLCRLNECAAVGQDRLGRVADTKTNNRTISAKLMSTGTWNARPWIILKTTAGADYVNVENDDVSSSGTTLPPGAQQVGNAATRTGSATWPTATKTLGFYVQEQVSLHDRLFITAAIRDDQNSAFGVKAKNALYPKASVSWLASDEPFFPDITQYVSQLRLRASYGASGVQPGRTDALVTFSAGSQNLANRGLTTGADVAGLTASQTGNPDLRPETSKELEVGFEASFLRSGRVRLDYTYFDKRTKDALISVPIAPSSAAPQLSPLLNVGSTRGWGHEATLNAQLLDYKDFGWDVTINGSHISSNVLDLGFDSALGEDRIIGRGGTTQQRKGYPINSRWSRPYTYNDANGDGVLQVAEVVVDTALAYFGYRFPRDNASISTGIDLLNRTLRINAFFDYRGGFLLQDGGNNFQCNTSPFACYETQHPSSPLELQARHVAKTYGTTVNGTSYKTDVGYLVTGQFWKFREMSAVYNLPTQVRKYLRSQNGSTVVFGMRNIHTWTAYTGVDPEEHDTPGDTQSNFQSPPARTYITLRFNLKY